MSRLAIALFTFAIASPIFAADKLDSLPEGEGLAAKYPNDAGLAKDKAVVFTDDFETGKTNADNRWGDIVFTDKKENVHAGTKSMELKLARPTTSKVLGLGYYHHLKEGYDTLFLRYYAKFSKETELFHGGTHAGGQIFARASGQPDAKPGIPADGKNEFTCLLDTWRFDEKDEKVASPGKLAVYVYHPEQRHQWGEQWFPSGRLLPYTTKPATDFFGSDFKKREDIVPERDKWICYELMVKANTPGKRDGRIAFWVDGKLAGDFLNLRLRDVAELKADRLGIGFYSQNEKVNKDCIMWYDDVVAATTYIGPMKSK